MPRGESKGTSKVGGCLVAAPKSRRRGDGPGVAAWDSSASFTAAPKSWETFQLRGLEIYSRAGEQPISRAGDLSCRVHTWGDMTSSCLACWAVVDQTMFIMPSRTGSSARGPVGVNRCQAVSRPLPPPARSSTSTVATRPRW